MRNKVTRSRAEKMCNGRYAQGSAERSAGSPPDTENIIKKVREQADKTPDRISDSSGEELKKVLSVFDDRLREIMSLNYSGSSISVDDISSS